MAKSWGVSFGSGDPRANTGLSPTFLIFSTVAGVSLLRPSISEVLEASVATGMYTWTYGPTTAIFFLLDGGAGLSNTDRYVSGILDPIAAVDEKVGTIDDSFGSTSVDPQTLLGYSKRFQEFWEGNANFNKSSGTWSIYSRGSSTLLREKDLTNTSSQATKS